MSSIKPSNTRGGTSHFPRTNFSTNVVPSTSSGFHNTFDRDSLESLEFPSNARFSMSVDSAKGLFNKPGENNCFVNCPVQILWHLDTFRKNFRMLTAHACTGDDCVFCALKCIYANYQFSDNPTLSCELLRKSLAVRFRQQQKFQLGSMDDASECYETILECLHDQVAVVDQRKSTRECRAGHCITHAKMSLKISEKRICTCGVSSEETNFYESVYYVSTESLVNHLNYKNDGLSFAQRLRNARGQGDETPCLDSSCKRQAYKIQRLLNAPEVVTIGFAWNNGRPDAGQVIDIVCSIQNIIKLPHLFHEPSDRPHETNYSLVGLLCYSSKHYCVFLFHPKQKIWFLYDDDCITKLENWTSVRDKCCKGALQPLLLLYSSTNLSPIETSSALKATFIVPLNTTTDHTNGKQGQTNPDSKLVLSQRHTVYEQTSAKSSENIFKSITDAKLRQPFQQNKKQKTVRFRKEVEGLSPSGEINISSIEAPAGGNIVSMPSKCLRCYSKAGILRVPPAFDPAEFVYDPQILNSSMESRNFSQMTNDFLFLSSIKEEEEKEEDQYINSQLVRNVLLRTMPKFNPATSRHNIYYDVVRQNNIPDKPSNVYDFDSSIYGSSMHNKLRSQEDAGSKEIIDPSNKRTTHQSNTQALFRPYFKPANERTNFGSNSSTNPTEPYRIYDIGRIRKNSDEPIASKRILSPSRQSPPNSKAPPYVRETAF